MVLTRDQAKDIFNHVLDNVLERDHTSPLKQALICEGIEDIFALLCIDAPTVESLKYYKLPFCGPYEVNKGDKALLRAFLKYVVSKTSCGNPSNDSFWTSITMDDFDKFRSHRLNFIHESYPVAAPVPSAAASVPTVTAPVAPTVAAPVPSVAASVPLATASEPSVAVVSPCKPKFQPLLPHEVKQEEIDEPVVAVNLEIDAKLDEEPVIYGEPVVQSVTKSQATLTDVPKVKGTKVVGKANKKPQHYKGFKVNSKSSAFHWYKEVPPVISASMNGEPFAGPPQEMDALQMWSMAKAWLFRKGGTFHSSPL
jgi:hypothetical protein